MAFEARNFGSCLMQAKWGFSDSASGSKWTSQFETYRHTHTVYSANDPNQGYDTGYALVITKNKLRGRGRALKLRFTASDDKDMQIVGWAIQAVGGSGV